MIDPKLIDTGKKLWWCSRGILDPIQVIIHANQDYSDYNFLNITRCDKSLAMGENKTVSIKTLFDDEIEARIYAFKIMSDLMIQENIKDQNRFQSIMQFINVRTSYTFEEISLKLETLFGEFLKTHPDLLFKHLMAVE